MDDVIKTIFKAVIDHPHYDICSFQLKYKPDPSYKLKVLPSRISDSKLIVIFASRADYLPESLLENSLG